MIRAKVKLTDAHIDRLMEGQPIVVRLRDTELELTSERGVILKKLRNLQDTISRMAGKTEKGGRNTL